MSKKLTFYARRYMSVSILEGGKKLKLPDQSEHGYHAVWLRHNCQCEECLTSSNQKTVTGQQLRGDLRIEQASVEDQTLFIKWTNKSNSSDHSGSLGVQWLKDNCYSLSSLESKSIDVEPEVMTNLPFVKYESVMESDEGLWRWLNYLNSFGLCVISGVPVSPEDESKKVCERIDHVQKTIYGESFDILSVPNPINIAYSTVGLNLHMDLAYYQSPPGLQALHCLRYDECVKGGESILLDSFAVVKEMQRKYPKQFETLTKIPATFQKIHFDRDHPVIMVYRRPHIVQDRHGRITKVSWSPQFEGPLAIPEHEVEEYYEAYVLLDEMFNSSPLMITHRLNVGEMLVFNNQRILHGRRSFELNGGVRHLKGHYVNIDEFASRFSVLSNKMNKEAVTIKHVMNGSSYLA